MFFSRYYCSELVGKATERVFSNLFLEICCFFFLSNEKKIKMKKWKKIWNFFGKLKTSGKLWESWKIHEFYGEKLKNAQNGTQKVQTNFVQIITHQNTKKNSKNINCSVSLKLRKFSKWKEFRRILVKLPIHCLWRKLIIFFPLHSLSSNVEKTP